MPRSTAAGSAWARPSSTPWSRACPRSPTAWSCTSRTPHGGPGRLVLFVAPAPGIDVDDELRRRIAKALRTQLSPRHVPDEIHAVPGVPRTLSGKKLEVPVKRILSGAEPDRAASRGSLANPDVLDAYEAFVTPR